MADPVTTDVVAEPVVKEEAKTVAPGQTAEKPAVVTPDGKTVESPAATAPVTQVATPEEGAEALKTSTGIQGPKVEEKKEPDVKADEHNPDAVTPDNSNVIAKENKKAAAADAEEDEELNEIRKRQKANNIVDSITETAEDMANGGFAHAHMLEDTRNEEQRLLRSVFNKRWGIGELSENMYAVVKEANEVNTKFGPALAMKLANDHTIYYYDNFAGNGGFIGKTGEFTFDQTDANATIATAFQLGWGGQTRENPLQITGPVEHRAMMWLAAQLHQPPVHVNFTPEPGHPVYQQLLDMQAKTGVVAEFEAAPAPKDKTHIDPEVDEKLETEIRKLRGYNGSWPADVPHTFDVATTLNVLEVFQTTFGDGTSNMDAEKQKALVESYEANPTRLEQVIGTWAKHSGLDMNAEIAKLTAPAAESPAADAEKTAPTAHIDPTVDAALIGHIQKYDAAGDQDMALNLLLVREAMARGVSGMNPAEQKKFVSEWSDNPNDQASCLNYFEEISGFKLADQVQAIKNDTWFTAEIANVSKGQNGAQVAQALDALRVDPSISPADKKAFTETYDTEGFEAAAKQLQEKLAPAPAAEQKTDATSNIGAPVVEEPAAEASTPVVANSKIAGGGPKTPQSKAQMQEWFQKKIDEFAQKGEDEVAAKLKVMRDVHGADGIDHAAAKKVYKGMTYEGGIDKAVKAFDQHSKVSVAKLLAKEENKAENKGPGVQAATL